MNKAGHHSKKGLDVTNYTVNHLKYKQQESVTTDVQVGLTPESQSMIYRNKLLELLIDKL
ncbi:MAG: hypothetical protein BGN96_07550 [Bacteroidales bacterium 45-6]|nr:MAG: hypothetical protein BGN96_07550 [Bacteroidales bacterium 45-6]